MIFLWIFHRNPINWWHPFLIWLDHESRNQQDYHSRCDQSLSSKYSRSSSLWTLLREIKVFTWKWHSLIIWNSFPHTSQSSEITHRNSINLWNKFVILFSSVSFSMFSINHNLIIRSKTSTVEFQLSQFLHQTFLNISIRDWRSGQLTTIFTAQYCDQMFRIQTSRHSQIYLTNLDSPY
jgi:hypothetical protein